MCGIAGIFSYRDNAKPVDGNELLRIRDAMARRGPDGEGLWLSPDRKVGLAHRRLAIIDLSDTGAQPMTSADGTLRITFNGEIYNYRQLQRELEAKGYVFQSSSDTEVLLHLYADRGKDMVHALRGMYAFALWDDRRKGLFLARDAFGIKPLYYADDGACVRFASQVKALLHGGAISSHPEPAGYVGFLTWGCVPEPFTLHREIRALPAGSHMWIDQGGTRGPARFFSVRDEFLRAEETSNGISAHEAVEHVVEALRDSVAHHLIADVPVAAFLSAGLDSATTVALASGASKGNLRTLTLGFQEYSGTPNDETALAALVSARFGASHETRWVKRSDFDDELDAILEAMDQPSTDGVNTYLVSKAAAGAGMKVALSGLGGDELFAGYPSFKDVPRIHDVARLLAFSPALGRGLRKLLSPLLGNVSSPKFAGLMEYGASYGGAYLLRRSLFMPWEIEEIIEPDVAAEGWRDLQTLPHLERDIQGLKGNRSIVSTLELDWYMRNQLLRDSDWAGMAHSLEVRVPYIDVTFFRAILPALISGLPIGKTDVAKALSPALPDEVLKRGKTGFLVPVQQWCATRSGDGPMDRGLRGWARIVIGKNLESISSGFPRIGRGKIFAFPESRPRGDHKPPERKWHRAQAGAARLAYRTVNGVLAASAVVLWPGARPATAARVCVFRIGNIGDIVCALPAIRSIRKAYPDAHLTLLTSPGHRGMPGAANVLEGNDWIDEIKVYHAEDIDSHAKRAALLKDLRARRFDVWIDLPNNLTTISRQFRDMAFTRMVGPRWARGWRIDTLKWAAQAQSEHLHFPNEVDRMLEVVRRASIPVGEIDFGLERRANVVSRIDALLSERDIAGRKLVAIAPGAKRSTNLWRAERFGQVAQQLAASGFVPVFVGGKGEAETCAAISSIAGGRSESFAGELSVSESCELLRRCELVVCLDSGVQHIASAVGTPCISLFSFWQMRGKWHPHGPRNVVLQKWVPCHTCLLEECPNANRCMTDIEVGDVMFHAKTMLRIGAPANPAIPRVAVHEASR
ncbi:MAG: asparagine synthase (glutamine-hydrolyzing) [Usitatibacter sp.]